MMEETKNTGTKTKKTEVMNTGALSEDVILNSKVRDSGGKAIFADNELCAQFVRDYVDIPELKQVTAEDIEDVSSQFVALFAEERNADRVKRIRLKTGEKDSNGEEKPPVFLISLIEHKTKVEYNICMQIFRYMVYIWESYEKEMEKQREGISKLKEFLYPPILPIVYYEGVDRWTAPMNFKDRVDRSDIFGEYIPDFKYYLMPIRKYTNKELMEMQDAISLIMMFNKLQTKEDVGRFLDEITVDVMQTILRYTPPHIVGLVADIYLMFQLKAEIPPEEAEANAGKLREKKVAQLFENANFGNLYAESKKIRQQIEGQKNQLEQLDKQIAEQDKQLAEQKKQLAEVSEKGIKLYIELLQEMNLPCETARLKLQEKYELRSDDAKEKIEKYWK